MVFGADRWNDKNRKLVATPWRVLYPLALGDSSSALGDSSRWKKNVILPPPSSSFPPSILPTLITNDLGGRGGGGSDSRVLPIVVFFPFVFSFLLVLLCSSRVHQRHISLVPVAILNLEVKQVCFTKGCTVHLVYL